MPEEVRSDESTLQSLIRLSLREAVNYHEDNLEPIMEQATDYYHGEPFGDEEEGRSKVVSRDVHDITWGQLPSLMRIFYGPEEPVRFRPRRADAVELAQQQTDYIRYLIEEENDGFKAYHDAFQDALVRRIGVFKWGYDESTRVKASRHKNLDRAAIDILLQDVAVEDIEVESVEADPEGNELATVLVHRREPYGKIWFEAVPPEEIVWTPGARDLDSAPLVAHYRDAKRSELEALGIPEDIIDRAQMYEARRKNSEGLEQTRLFDKGRTAAPDDTERDPSQEEVPFAEAYALVENDDGDEELRLFYVVGAHFDVVDDGEVVDEVPLAIITPYLESHTIVGASNYDQNKDIQLIKSHTFRGMLNSLSAAVEPSVAAWDGYVNIGDLVSPEIGGLIRTHRPPREVLMDFTHDFLGHATLPVLEYMDQMRQSRSGWDQSAAGLDPESLQSSTRTGVSAHLTASQARIELIARTFAETGIKRLYKGLLRLVVRCRNRPEIVQLRGQWVEVDPRHWHADMDVEVNVPIGHGTLEERRQFLMMTLEAQKQLLEMGSPIVTYQHIRYTLGELMKLYGRQDADRMFAPWGEQQEQMFQQQQAQNQQPDPTMLLAQIEQSKVQQQAQSDQMKQQIEQAKLQADQAKEQAKLSIEQTKLELERGRLELAKQKQEQDAALKELEIELANQREVNAQYMKAQMETYKIDNEMRQRDLESRRQSAASAIANRPPEEPPPPPAEPEPTAPAPGVGGMV